MAALVGVFALQPFHRVLLPRHFPSRVGRHDIHRDPVIEEPDTGQVAHDPGIGHPGPTAEDKHRMMAPVQDESAVGLPDTVAMPAALLDRQCRVDRPLPVAPFGRSRIEKIE